MLFENLKSGEPVHSFEDEKKGKLAVINASSISGESLAGCGGKAIEVENFVCIPIELTGEDGPIQRVRTNLYASDGAIYSSTNDMVAKIMCDVLENGVGFPVTCKVIIKSSQRNANYKYPVLMLI